MTPKPTDLIAIANSDLALKLNAKAAKEAQLKAQPTALDAQENASFGDEIWRAVFTLNLFRYALALFLLATSAFVTIDVGKNLLARINHPDLFLTASAILLTSAIAFTYVTRTRRFKLENVLLSQFLLDLILASLLVHATGSVISGFSMLYLLVVTTGSVVLNRRLALGLASGAIILMFYEHIFTVLLSGELISPRYDLLAGYGIFLLALALIVSYLASRIRAAEKKSFIPGSEGIEEFLVREEINALKSALQSTDGNKTEAAKLLGMTFRSFRYKLTKYDID